MAKKQVANENSVEIAERTLRDLQEKHDRVAAARADDDREMGNVSYKAHSGDTEASKRLDSVVERMLRRDLELKSITSAIMVAQQNLAEAQDAERQAEQASCCAGGSRAAQVPARCRHGVRRSSRNVRRRLQRDERNHPAHEWARFSPSIRDAIRQLGRARRERHACQLSFRARF